ncbi:Vacuolar sorting protein 9 (VPS9) domain [Phytophthora infestans]|uniref:Vacuolar sorting protein 9 (VPS9) domain n=1 Tax=Phytophthora infestans TaxID=4787 RepID=A0A833SF28_PHYIN|nr:Vacuolar sorting protein 9 (VPS9) domain [Phytophthora infestans]
MMFWGRGGGGKSATTSATEHADATRWVSEDAQSAATSTIPIAPSYVLSEQRRSELLLAARTNRVSWVDGVDQRDRTAGSNGFPSNLSASIIPSHCHDALMSVNDERAEAQILPNELQLTEEEPETATDTRNATRRYRTLFQELREQETLLNQWQRSHSPRTKKLMGHDREMAFLVGFRELVTLLKSAQAAELVYRIQSFVKRAELWELPLMLRAIATRDRPGGKVQDFVSKLVEQIRHSDKLRTLLQGDEDTETQRRHLHVRDPYGVDLLHEVLEAFLMEKLYSKTLTPSSVVESQDEAFHHRVSLLGFVTFKHLDLPIPKTKEQEQTWLRLAKQLEGVTLCPSPRRKMDAVMRVCQDLTTFLKAQTGGRFPSADEFLPALIYVVLRANPRELKRNVAFILEYRNPAKLVSEPGYFFTHLVSSVAFLEEVNGSSLTISSQEFDEELRRSKESLRLKGVHNDVDHEVASNASSGSTGEPVNVSANVPQKERRQQLLADDPGTREEEKALPTVLEVRARRLAVIGLSSD